MNTSDESSFQFSICSAAGDRLILLTDADSSVKSAIVGRASLRDGLSKKDPFLSRNHARVEIEGVGLNAVAKIVATHRNPCYVVRKSGDNVVKGFWDAEENCELINEKSDGSRDEIQLHDGDEFRFSKDGDRFRVILEKHDKTRINGEEDEEEVAETQMLFGDDGESGEVDNDIRSNVEAAADTLLLPDIDEINCEDDNNNDDDVGGDTDVDDELMEERDVEKTVEPPAQTSIDTAAERKTLFPAKSKKFDLVVGISKPSSYFESDSQPDGETGSFCVSPTSSDRPKNRNETSTSSSSSQKRPRRLPAWWNDLVQNDDKDERCAVGKHTNVRKKRKTMNEESFIASDDDGDEGEAPKKKRRKTLNAEREMKIESTSEKVEAMKSPTGNSSSATTTRESKAKPGQRVKSSTNSKLDTGSHVLGNDVKNDVSDVNTDVNGDNDDGRDVDVNEDMTAARPDGRDRVSRNIGCDKDTVNGEEKPMTSMFSRANFGTLMNVLDDSYEEEPVEKSKPVGTPASFDNERRGKSDDDAIERNDDINAVDAFSDRDSWEEMSPPSSPRGNNVQTSSTPKKNSYSHSFNQKTASKTKNDNEQTLKASSTSKRPKCPYGKDCYRKNPVHFKESCHPGDADWIEGEEEEDDEDEESHSQKPYCEYGADCYRKNPQHRRDFRHPKPGDRPSRKAAIKAKNQTKKKKKRDDDDDEDEDDEYESSFINDDSDLDPDETFDSSSDSSDADGGKDDDDDDFQIDEDDVDEEDEKQLKRLKKEAKRFAKK